MTNAIIIITWLLSLVSNQPMMGKVVCTILIAFTLLIVAIPSNAAETFVPVTKDNKVTSIDQVQVKKVVLKEAVEEPIEEITK